jgi:hypothetical protein
MSLTLKIKESRLSPDGLFFLRAARYQSVAAEIALRPDADGYVAINLGANGEEPKILVKDHAHTISWTMSEKLITAYRAFEIGPIKLINEAGRELRTWPVVGLRWTIRDWITEFGQQFGISSPTYVRQMCRGQVIGLSGAKSSRQRKPYQAKLPAPFRGVQDGGRWFVTV